VDRDSHDGRNGIRSDLRRAGVRHHLGGLGARHAGLGPGGVLLAVGAFGPAVAAALVLHWRGEPLRPWLASVVRWRVPLRFYAFALGLPVALFSSVNLTLAALGERVELDRADEALAGYPGSFLAVALIGVGQEEPGWRGCALGRLQERFSPLKATLVLGVIWGVWHVPLYGLAFVGPMMSSGRSGGSVTAPVRDSLTAALPGGAYNGAGVSHKVAEAATT
jgi:membrane protease YdiL (CAAX protease family)